MLIYKQWTSVCVNLPVADVWCSSGPHCTEPAAAAGQADPFSAASECPEWPPFLEESHQSAENLDHHRCQNVNMQTKDSNTVQKTWTLIRKIQQWQLVHKMKRQMKQCHLTSGTYDRLKTRLHLSYFLSVNKWQR